MKTIVVENPECSSQIPFVCFSPPHFLPSGILEFEFLPNVETDRSAQFGKPLPQPRRSRLREIKRDKQTGIEVNSHRRPAATISLPALPGSGFRPQILSSFSKVPDQSVFSGVAGTSRAKVFRFSVIWTSSPSATSRRTESRLVLSLLNVTVFITSGCYLSIQINQFFLISGS